LARCFFVMLITALLAGCGDTRESRSAERNGMSWSAEQLQAFQQFKLDPAQRAPVADAVARSFPVTFNHDEQRAAGTAAPVAQESLVELLGRPNVSFSLVERPEYLGAERPRLDFDPRELHILLYDIDCLAESGAVECAHLEAIALRQRVLRVRVVRGRREEALMLLSPPESSATHAMKNPLIAEMPGSGWRKVPHSRAMDLAQQFSKQILDAEFYEHEDGAVVFGRLLSPFELIRTSETEAVCIAAASDIFVPSLLRSGTDTELRRDANVRVVVFEHSLDACGKRYADGRFVLLKGESLAATQLVRIHDLFNRRFAAECNVPAWMTPQGLLHASGGSYRISVAPPPSGRDRWAFDVTVQFALEKGGEYTALVAISPWGTRMKECRSSVSPQRLSSQ
jgi:hypothetical protein